MGNGSGYERGLRDRYYEHDSVGIRIPASGGGTSYDLPDVVGIQMKAEAKPWQNPSLVPSGQKGVVMGPILFGHELKKTGGETIRFGTPELWELIAWAYDWGAIPLATVRFPYDTEFYSAIPTETFLEGIEEKLHRGEPVTSFRIKKEQRKEMTSFTALMEGEPVGDIATLDELDI
jgi:Holliday junction resolvase